MTYDFLYRDDEPKEKNVYDRLYSASKSKGIQILRLKLLSNRDKYNPDISNIDRTRAPQHIKPIKANHTPIAKKPKSRKMTPTSVHSK